MAIDKIVAEYRLELDGLKQDVNQIKGQLKSTEEAAKSSADQVSGKLTNAFKSVGAAIASAFAIEQITSFARESVDLAAKAEGVKRAFDNLNRAGLLDELRTATKGTVNDLQLMTTAVKAANFKIPLDQLAKLLKFAQQRAVETGDSIDYLVESIVLGISRKSIPILDNLGLSASEVQNEFQKTGDMAIAVGNIIDRSMTGAGDATLTAAEKQAQLTASIENFKLQIGNSLLPVVEKLWSGLAKLVTGFSDVKDESIQTREESARLLVQNKKEYDQLQSMIDRYDNLSAKTVKTQEDKAELSRIVFELQSEFGKSVTQINNETGALELNRTAIIKQMQSRAAMMSQDAQSILAQQAKLNYLKDEQIAIQKTLEEQMKAGQGNDIIAQKYMNASQMASHYQEQIDSLTKELQKLGVSTESLVIPSTDATGETLKDVNKIIQENIKSLQEYNAELVKLGLAPSVTLDQALKYFEEYDALNKTEQEKEIDAVNKKYEKL